MPLDSTSLAAAVGVAADNVVFAPEVANIARKIMIVATGNPAETGLPIEVPKRILSAEEVGAESGYGFMAHRLARAVFRGSQGIEAWITYQEETGSAAAATGSVVFSGTSLGVGPLHGYIAGEALPSITVTEDQTLAQICAAYIAAVNADANCPVTALVDGVNTAKANLTAKSKGPWGNGITITFNENLGESLPTNLVATITDMASGAGIPDIDDALAGMGEGDAANERYWTDGVHGYGLDATTVAKISAYNGEGDDYVGCYRKLVSRPMRWLNGDTSVGSDALSDLVDFADARRLDRTSGVVAVPCSPNHPAEIAAVAIGTIARINQAVVAQHYVGQALPGILPGTQAASGDRWTSEYDNRDAAVKNGISPTIVEDGAVKLQNLVTFYRPSTVPVSSNSYRSMRNIAIIQNIVSNIRTTFSSDEWKGISIVKSISKVTVTADAVKVRDLAYVVATYIQLAKQFEGKAWLFTADYTISEIKKSGAVSIRSGGTGFDARLKVILSGEGGIFDTVVEHDIALTVVL